MVCSGLGELAWDWELWESGLSDNNKYKESRQPFPFIPSSQCFAYGTTDWLQGAGTEEACLIDILASRSNDEINAINEIYKKGNRVAMISIPVGAPMAYVSYLISCSSGKASVLC